MRRDQSQRLLRRIIWVRKLNIGWLDFNLWKACPVGRILAWELGNSWNWGPSCAVFAALPQQICHNNKCISLCWFKWAPHTQTQTHIYPSIASYCPSTWPHQHSERSSAPKIAPPNICYTGIAGLEQRVLGNGVHASGYINLCLKTHAQCKLNWQ